MGFKCFFLVVNDKDFQSWLKCPKKEEYKEENYFNVGFFQWLYNTCQNPINKSTFLLE